MQTAYDDRVPNPDRFTPQRPIRVPDDIWDAYGEAVGARDRSADIKAYIDWRLANPHAELPAHAPEEVVDLLVRVRTGPAGRRVEVLPFAGATTKTVNDLREEVVRAIVDHFQSTKPAPRSTSKRKP